MRKRFAYFVLIPLVFLALVVYLWIDRWVESGLESAGEAIVGAKVEIDNLSVALSPLGIEFDRLQVANPRDPWKNLFETGQVRCLLDFGQLLRGKYIVETVEVQELLLGTKRSTDGSLPQEPDDDSSPSFLREASKEIANRVQQAPLFDLEKLRKELKIDSLINVSTFKSIQHIDTLKAEVQRARMEWDATFSDLESTKQRLAEIESSLRSINPNELKTIEAITSAIATVNTAHMKVNEILQTFTARRSSVVNRALSITASVDAIDHLAKEDYERVKRLARLPDMNVRGLANLLVGKKLLNEVEYYLGWVEYARTTIRAYTPEPAYEKPKRFEGQDIHFPSERSYPKLWIKKIHISGGTDKRQDPEYFYAVGEATNITDNQRLTGQPLAVRLSATKGGQLRMKFSALFDRRPAEPVDQYNVEVDGIKVGDFSLGRSDFLPSSITNSLASLRLHVRVPGNQFDSRLDLAFRNVTMRFERAARNDVERLTRSVLEGINTFNVGLRLWNTKGPVDVALTTDLDDLLASRTQQVIGAELARLQNEIRARVDKVVAEKKAEFEQLFRQKRDEAMVRLRSYEEFLNTKLALVENKKKELEARVEEEKKKQTEAAKKKLEEAVKGLFKKQ